MEQLFEALSATSLKADLAVEKEQMTISLKLPKDCKEAVWIQEIAAFTNRIATRKIQTFARNGFPLKGRPRRWHKKKCNE